MSASERQAGNPARRRNKKSLAAPPVKRDPVGTRNRILRAAVLEFCRHGFSGARIDRIQKRAGTNMRMIYHYFGDKDNLYLAVLESVYRELRLTESKLDLAHVDPVEGMARLVDFTFAHLARRPEFISLMSSENLLRGKYLKKSRYVPEASMPLIETIRDLLRRGKKEGVFRSDVDPLQLYVSVLSLCYVHISNRYTLSITFNRDLADPAWLEKRRSHVKDVVLRFLRTEP